MPAPLAWRAARQARTSGIEALRCKAEVALDARLGLRQFDNALMAPPSFIQTQSFVGLIGESPRNEPRRRPGMSQASGAPLPTAETGEANMMKFLTREIVVLAALDWALLAGCAPVQAPPSSSSAPPASSCCGPITASGQTLRHTLDASDVEHLWLPRQHVDWSTGKPDPTAEGFKSHCSAFAAAMGARLDVYMLRPPEHSQILLANAQAAWLASDSGRAAGWRELHEAYEAQAAANRGELVVAAFQSADPKMPGHMAIIRPSLKSNVQLADEGPEIIQAGAVNRLDWNVRDGFARHPGAWPNGIKYFAHVVPAK